MNPEPHDRTPERSTDWFVDHLLADAERFAAVLAAGGLDAPVAACPGWDIAKLAEHLGQVHRWAEFCVRLARPPSADERAALGSFDPADAAAWMRDGAGRLAATLRTIDPDGPTWHPFPADPVARLWPRRMAHETAVHRWDAEHAAGRPAGVDAALASDGIDEYFEVMLPRKVARDGITLPVGSLHVHCTDTDGEWLVRVDGSGYHLTREHAKGDAVLRGPAAPIVLRLWGRTPDDAGELAHFGDEAVLADWLALGG